MKRTLATGSSFSEPNDRADDSLDLELSSPQTSFFRRALRSRRLVVGEVLIGVVLLMAVLAPVLAPFPPLQQAAQFNNQPPFFHEPSGALHLLGTDPLGRGVVLSLKQMPYVEAAHALGASHPRSLFKHVLPGVWTPVIVVVTQQVGSVMIAESSLTFLCIGVPRGSPPGAP